VSVDTTVVIGTLYGHSEHQLDAIRSSAGRPVSILIDDQRGQEAAPKGFPAVYQVLIDAAFSDPHCQYVWVCGDDVWPQGDCLARAQRILSEDPTIGAIFPVELWFEQEEQFPAGVRSLVTMLPFDGRKVYYTHGDIRQVHGPLEDRTIEQLFAGMACACIRRDAWQRVGGFDHALGRGYCEDTDWGFRCWKSGFRIVNDRGGAFIHDKKGTYNRLVQAGTYGAEEPTQAAVRLKAKYPFLWPDPPRDNSREVLAILKGWYEEARRGH
jgi:GT2 family glycosyltransferase